MKMLKATLIALISLALFGACNSLTKSNSQQSNQTHLSLQTSSPSSSSSAMTTSNSSTPNNGMVIANSTDTLRIDTAKVMIREIEFHGSEKMEGHQSGDHEYSHHMGDEDSTEFEAGPFILDLNLDTTLTTIAINKLPNGTYNFLSFQIHRPLPSQTIADSDFVGGPNNAQRFSIVVKGTYDGKPFVFKTPRTIHEHIALNPPLTISDSLSSYNATIKVDVSKWFVDHNGDILDPTKPNNVYMINWSIRRSFFAFKDNNEDGHEDHDGWGMWNHDNHQNNQNSDSTGTSNGGGDNG